MATGQTRFIGGIIPKKSAVPGKIPTGTTIGEIFSNLPDQKLWGFDGVNSFEYGSKTYFSLTGGTISGTTFIMGGLSANTVSGGTLFSGSTNLYAIFQPLGSPSTQVQNGLNTYTGGTVQFPTVNVSALTINTLSASGNSFFQGLTAVTLSSTTISAATGTIHGILNLSDDVSNPDLKISSIFNQRIIFHDNNTSNEWFLHTQAFGGGSGYGTFGIGTSSNNANNFLDLTTGGTFIHKSNLTTGFTITNTTGGTPIFRVNSIDKRVGINTVLARESFEVSGNTLMQALTASTISATFISGGTLFSGNTNLYSIFQPIGANSVVGDGTNTYTGGTFYNQTVNVSALTINTLTASGNTNLQGVTATTLSSTTISGGTLFSGSTNLYDIFLTTNDGNDITRVQPGINTYTGGTGNFPTVNVSALTIDSLTVSGNSQLAVTTATSISATTISGGTLFSGSTNLYDIFQPTGANSVVGDGTNTYTGGTFYNQTVNVSALTINTLIASGNTNLQGVTATTLSSTTISATTVAIVSNSATTAFSIINSNGQRISILDSDLKARFYSGGGINYPSITFQGNADQGLGTDTNRLSLVTNSIARLIVDKTTGFIGIGAIPGSYLLEITGTTKTDVLTANTIMAANITGSSISATTISGGTLFSGSTNLYDIFQPTGANSVVGDGTNTYTGGTFYNQTVNVSALTINTLIVSGNSQLAATSATLFSGGTVSGGTLYSGSTNLYSIFDPIYSSPYRTYILTAGTSFDFTGNVNTVSVNKSVGSSTQVNLPSSPNTNDFYVVKDRKGDSNTNPITVSGGTKTIDGNTSYVIKVKNNPSLTFLFDGEEYIVI